jgi:hypothetical protein
MCFCAYILEHDTQLCVEANYIESEAKRLLDISDFKSHALAEELRALRICHPGKLLRPSERKTNPKLTFGMPSQDSTKKTENYRALP